MSLRAAGFYLAALVAASAAEPEGHHIYPIAGQQGATVSVTAGKFPVWPPSVWVDAPGIHFKPSATKGKFDVEIAKDAAPGPHLVRFFNAEGTTEPCFFIVSTEPETPEQEPNDDYKSPQKIAALPATISGRLDKIGDVDSFAVTLKKGQTLTAWVEAYVLASTFDGLLRIVDSNGLQLAFNHDGLTLDPYLSWTAPRDGTFVLQLLGFPYPAVQKVDLAGGEGCVYRLHLTTAPQPRLQFPAPSADEGPEIAEQEPNDTPASAQAIPIPSVVSGGIGKPKDEDCYSFIATKNKLYALKVFSARAGTPLDAWLKIEDKTGKQLARNDDAEGTLDPELTWKAPSDGTFIAVIGDLTHHGGPDYVYRFTIAEAVPAVTAIAAEHSITIPAGTTGEIKTAVKRTNGFKSKLQISARDLPAGVSAADVDVPEKDGDVVVKISADAGMPVTCQPFQLVLRETESGHEHPVVYSMVTTTEVNGVPHGYTQLVINSTNQLWLTVKAPPAKKETPKTEPPKTEPPK